MSIIMWESRRYKAKACAYAISVNDIDGFREFGYSSSVGDETTLTNGRKMTLITPGAV